MLDLFQNKFQNFSPHYSVKALEPTSWIWPMRGEDLDIFGLLNNYYNATLQLKIWRSVKKEIMQTIYIFKLNLN